MKNGDQIKIVYGEFDGRTETIVSEGEFSEDFGEKVYHVASQIAIYTRVTESEIKSVK